MRRRVTLSAKLFLESKPSRFLASEQSGTNETPFRHLCLQVSFVFPETCRRPSIFVQGSATCLSRTPLAPLPPCRVQARSSDRLWRLARGVNLVSHDPDVSVSQSVSPGNLSQTVSFLRYQFSLSFLGCHSSKYSAISSSSPFSFFLRDIGTEFFYTHLCVPLPASPSLSMCASSPNFGGPAPPSWSTS